MASKDFLERIARFSPKQLAVLALELQQKVERLVRSSLEPVAIVGLGCRFPGGASTPEKYWQLLVHGVDAVGEIPSERWDNDSYYDSDPDAPGKIATRWGGFLSGIDRFDPDFFGIAPREAVRMDPQQRLVLEVAWEALERGGYSPQRLDHTRTGVFLGICNGDYFQTAVRGDPRDIDAYLASGSAGSVASGRLSYLLGLRGPSVSIDTACSSSLVAIHLACQSLRARESAMAIAGGVNVILRPEVTMALSRAHMMAADGRCKAFDSRADGFVRSEGCGLVVLKRLADAQADGDTIFAVIRASAVNQDGRSSGLTAPNGPSQEAVIRDALAMAELGPCDIDYVEAHGTGTSLGDPIELQALGAALGAGRAADAPLLVGSVKTNIGHLESAAGVAGLIKTVLALRERVIPPHLHLQQRNSHVDWRSLPIEIPTALTPWPQRGTRRAGVSSFGFSGTNAHVILEEAPPLSSTAVVTDELRRPYLFPVAARSHGSLAELARLHVQHLGELAEPGIADAAFTAGVGRAHFDHRLAVVASDRSELIEKLNAAAAGGEIAGVARGRAAGAPEVAFLFSGQGAQYAGMGRALHATEPVFRAVIGECEEALEGLLAAPLTRLLFESDRAELERTANLQPALFALEVALAALWRSWGVIPSIVMGHSLGEFAAACVAGMFSAGEGARLVAHRGRLMGGMRGIGRMVAVTTDESTVRRFTAALSDISIAAINAPDQIVISGMAQPIDAVLREFAAAGIAVHPLEVSHAFHSSQMDEMLAEFEAEARRIEYREPTIDIVSNVTGALYGEGGVGAVNDVAAYWRRHVRSPVLFQRGMAALEKRGCRLFVEIGPSPILVAMGRRCLTRNDAQWLPSLRRGSGEREQLTETAARLYVSGVDIDWSGFAGPGSHRRVPLPTYPFERSRYWMSDSSKETCAATPVHTERVSGHPLIGGRLDTGAPTVETFLDLERYPYLDHHRIGGRVVTPGALLLEMARAAGALFLSAESVAVEGMRFREMLVVPESGVQRVHVTFHDIGEARAAFSIYSRTLESVDRTWIRHAEGNVVVVSARDVMAHASLTHIRSQCTEPMAPEDFYSQLAPRGIVFGVVFRGIRELFVGGGRVLGRLSLPESSGHDGATCAPYAVHPALLDAALQLVGVAVMRAGRDEMYMQVSLGRMRLERPVPRELWGSARLREDTVASELIANVMLFDEEGNFIGVLEEVGLARVPPGLLAASLRATNEDWVYEVHWRPEARQREEKRSLDVSALGRKLRAELESLAGEHGLAVYDELSPRMERAAARFVIRALQEVGAPLKAGERLAAAELMKRCNVLPAFERLFQRMLAILAEEGVLLERSSGDFEVRAVPIPWPPEAAPISGGVREAASECQHLLKQFPAFRAEITLLERCGSRLAAVLQGKQDPLQLLFPGGDPLLLEDLYRNSPAAQAHNELVGRAVAALAAKRAPGTFRVLEIGAGTGATTHKVLSALPAEAEYVFTDISPLFVARAARTFARHRCLSFKVFDVDDKSATEQGFTPHSFDVIVAANVLHATRDLRRTLSRVSELLRPGGRLVLLEGTRALRSVDLTFGLTEGWWRFADRELRPRHALLTPAQWKALLESCGFDEIELIPGEVASTAQGLILARAVPSARRWVICAESMRNARAVAAACDAQGIECALLARNIDDAVCSDREYEIDPTNAAEIGRVLLELRDAGFDASVALFVAAQTAPAAAGSVAAAMEDCLAAGAWLRALGAIQNAPRLWLLTCDAQPVAGMAPSRPAQAALWGWTRVASLERPDKIGGAIDLAPANTGARDPPGFNITDLGCAIDAISSARDEDQLGIRNGERFVPRLARTPPPLADIPWSWSCRGDRAYLVTGWMGGLGLLLVPWLVAHGARHLVLVGRRELLPGAPATAKAQAVVDSMRAQGAHVTTLKADITDADSMRVLLTRFGADLPVLGGVFHIAVDMSANAIEQLDAEAYRSMFAAKAGSAVLLDELTGGLELDCFVLFSSTTALWGAQGLAHYAAANQVLDSLAHARRAAGRPALAVNWGTWDMMRVASAEQRASFESAGLLPMPADSALGMLGRLLADGRTQSAVAAIDWNILKPIYESRRARPLFREIATVELAPQRTATGAADLEPWDLSAMADPDGDAWLFERIRAEVARVLGLSDAREIDLTRSLFEMGLDSLMAVELRGRLERRAGLRLPSTLTFDFPTVTALAGFLGPQLSVEREEVSL